MALHEKVLTCRQEVEGLHPFERARSSLLADLDVIEGLLRQGKAQEAGERLSAYRAKASEQGPLLSRLSSLEEEARRGRIDGSQEVRSSITRAEDLVLGEDVPAASAALDALRSTLQRALVSAENGAGEGVADARCRLCGEAIDDTPVCLHCGFDLHTPSKACSHCGREVLISFAHCPFCGSRVADGG